MMRGEGQRAMLVDRLSAVAQAEAVNRAGMISFTGLYDFQKVR